MAAPSPSISRGDSGAFEFTDEAAGVGAAAAAPEDGSQAEDEAPAAQAAPGSGAAAPGSGAARPLALTWGRPGSLSAKQASALAALHRLAPNELSDADACRFLRGKAFSPERALRLRADCAAWWAASRGAHACTRAQLEEAVLGRRLASWTPALDARNRPVVVVDASRHRPGLAAPSVAALLACLDAALEVAPTGDLTVVFDLRAFTPENSDVPTAKKLVAALQAGYPERLGQAVIVGAPRVFSVLWAAIRVLLDARTAQARCVCVPLCPGGLGRSRCGACACPG